MNRTTLISGLNEDDLMTLRWNADVHTVYQKREQKYKLLDNKGEYLGDVLREKDGCRIVFYKNEINNEKFQKLIEIKNIVNKILSNQLENPNKQVKKIIPFSQYIDSYQRYSFLQRYAA